MALLPAVLLSLSMVLVQSEPPAPAPEPPADPAPAPEPPADPAPAPEPPADPAPAEPAPEPEPEPAPEPAPEPEPEPTEPMGGAEPQADEPDQPAGTERERALEQELADARARIADLERIVDALRQEMERMRSELASRQKAAATRQADRPVRAAAPASTSTPASEPGSTQASDAPAPRAPSAPEKPEMDQSASSRLGSPTPAAPPAMQADVGAQGAAGVLSGLRQAYAGAFPSIPSPSSDGFHQFSGDVVKWAAAQQRAMRLPVSWNVQIVRFERAAARDRVLKAIARPSGAAGSAVGTFIIKVPRAAAEQVMQGDYRGKSFTVAGTLAPIVRFAPDRPTDGMSTHHSTFVGPYCEASIVLEAETIEPSADGS